MTHIKFSYFAGQMPALDSPYPRRRLEYRYDCAGWDGDRIVREETDNQRTTVVYEPGSFVPMLRIDDTQ